MTDRSRTVAPPEPYAPQEIEPRWQRTWEEHGLYRADLHDTQREKHYFLTMFPYPSGNLHVGHWYAEAPADAAARYLRMRGKNVFFPMGFDAFGLPAENAAIQAAQQGSDVHPAHLTRERITYMTTQFRQMGAMFDWSRTLATCEPDYYRWNQWFFVKMYEKGLAYRKESYVNWDPVDQTVLANEQVIEGRGERSGALVERRLMPQWHFRITAYADELLSFEGLDWPERVKAMQTNWIGRSEGAEVTFRTESGDALDVFTTRPDTLWGATFMVLAPEHPLVDRLTAPDRRAQVEAYVAQAGRMSEIDRQSDTREKTGVFTGAYAINPVNDARIPIYVADYVLVTYGSGAIMAVPAHDERDFAFARAHGLKIVPVVRPEDEGAVDGDAMTEAYAGDGVMVNSGPMSGTPTGKGGEGDGIEQVIRWLEREGLGRGQTTYRLRDWLISRQRYWGTPIPMLYCDACGIVPEREENLPVLLPEDVAFMPTGESPLKHHETFQAATCPQCGGPARRETDTMDTFMDSAWYWFRYLAPGKEDGPIDRDLAGRWTPVDTYTGGIEHAILHLLYARFFTKAIRDLGLVDHGEPFLRLRNQGMILGEDGEKMSKRRGNVVDPDELVATYGADAVRAYLMFIGPWSQGGPWSYQGIEGVVRFLHRVWALVLEPAAAGDASSERVADLRRAAHRAVREVSEDMEAFRFNTAVAELMTLQNAMSKAKTRELVAHDAWREATSLLLRMLAPIAPHIAEELWHRSGHDGSVHLASWPEVDEEALARTQIDMVVQVNGKVRGQVRVPADAQEAEVLSAAKADPNVTRYLEDAALVREIVVPGKLVNLVVK
ncbi:MAG: leucine--tRNA ligase [Trueperaceae bacterium]|nr:leucine--tRNA ligase [Trueperaceae bacterium]